MREVFGGKKSVVWILTHGPWTKAAVELMNKDTQEVTRLNEAKRVAWESHRALDVQPTNFARPKYCARDPFPDERARRAAKQRCDMHDAENRWINNLASVAGEGACSAGLSWVKSRRSCMRCGR